MKVDAYELELRLAAMQRALVAHDALNRRLSQVDVPSTELPDKLMDGITLAERLALISNQEAKCLKWINQEANKAKHGGALPF